MAPLFRIAHQQDALAPRAASALHAGDLSAFKQIQVKVNTLVLKYYRMADTLGLSSCGSELALAIELGVTH